MKLEQARPEPAAAQETGFLSGNEMAALAAVQLGYHVMGYYPITPSTEIAERLDEMKAEGEHAIAMIPADGEHSAAGICYGAAVAGARVFNATSAQGLLYSLEQMPVHAGTRMPGVLNLVTRAVSGPLNIRGDHSDLYFTLNTGWIVLLARDPQAVYDLNIVALKLSEHADVRLPVIVAFDGFFTSHQRRRVSYFADAALVRAFVGPQPDGFPHALDPGTPYTFGAYMNDADLIVNRYQLHQAMEAARRVLPAILQQYESLSGRRYPLVETYRTEDARAALLVLGSAADTARDAVDRLREQGLKVGVITFGALRPFPADEVRRACRGLRVLIVGERADSYGSQGGNLSHEVKAALKDDPSNRSQVITRIFGLGGKDFTTEDAEALLRLGLLTAAGQFKILPFDYHGVTPVTGHKPARSVAPISQEERSRQLVRVEVDETTGEVKPVIPPPRKMLERPRRIAPGHGACPGCGIFPSLNLFLQAIEGDVVVLYQTGCAMIVTTGYPYSAHRVTYVHNLFQNGAATLSGIVEAYHERRRRGELPGAVDLTFLMITGDGGMDIGLGSALGAAARGHRMMIVEYDNQGYMNTGSQLSYATPLGVRTATSNAKPGVAGKTFHHKDTPQIMAAANIPYVFTGVESNARDLWKKAAKAQHYARHHGLAYGKLLSVCPPNWVTEERHGAAIVQAAVDSCFFPLYEVEVGKTRLTYDPEASGKRIPVGEWLGRMGRSHHLLLPEHAAGLAEFAAEVERRWRRLKAKHEHANL
jgi:pyruvate ferredoxin oxidoreductase alpha subunit